MDDAVNVFGLDAEFLGLAGAGAGQAAALFEHVFGAHGLVLLLGFGFFDNARDPPAFVAVPLVAVASIDAYHFPEQLTLGPAFLLGERFNFLDDGRRDREAHDLGCSAHVHKPVNGLILVKLIITGQRNSSTSVMPVMPLGYLSIFADYGSALDVQFVFQCPQMQPRIVILALAALFAGIANADFPGYDPYGGWLKLAGTNTGFFHTQQIDGRWWLVTPDGHAFFSKGVDNVSYRPEAASSPKPPSDLNGWAASTVRQLRGWGFNTAGAWSVGELYDKGIVYAPIVNMAAAVGRDVWLKGGEIGRAHV